MHQYFGFSNDLPSGPLTEAQYLGTQTPCPTKYDQIKYEKYNGHERSPIYSSPRSKRFKPLEKSDLPSPTSYNILEDKKKSFKLAKAKNIRFVDEIIQRKKNIPGPQTYDTAKADRWISTGTGKSYKWKVFLNYFIANHWINSIYKLHNYLSCLL